MGKGIVKTVGTGNDNRHTNFGFELGGHAFEIHFDDLGGAGADKDNHGGVAISFDRRAEALEFVVVVEFGADVAFFEFGHGIAWLGKDHHTHSILQEIATGFGANHQKEAVFNFLVEPSDTANGAEGVIVAGFALKVEGVGFEGCSHGRKLLGVDSGFLGVVGVGEQRKEVAIGGVLGHDAFGLRQQLIGDVEVVLTDGFEAGVRFGHLEDRFALDAGNPNVFDEGQHFDDRHRDFGNIGIDQVALAGAIAHEAREAQRMGARFFAHGGGDPVGGKEGIKTVVGDDQAIVGIVEGGCKATADDITENIKENNVVFVEGVEFAQQFDGFTHDITTATRPSRRATGFDAINAAIAVVNDIFGPNVFVVVVPFFEGVDDCRDEVARKCKGAVVLGVTTDLQDFHAPACEGDGDVATGGRFADATFAIDCEFHGVSLE